jgi:hypothetical protein
MSKSLRTPSRLRPPQPATEEGARETRTKPAVARWLTFLAITLGGLAMTHAQVEAGVGPIVPAKFLIGIQRSQVNVAPPRALRRRSSTRRIRPDGSPVGNAGRRKCAPPCAGAPSSRRGSTRVRRRYRAAPTASAPGAASDRDNRRSPRTARRGCDSRAPAHAASRAGRGTT